MVQVHVAWESNSIPLLAAAHGPLMPGTSAVLLISRHV